MTFLKTKLNPLFRSASKSILLLGLLLSTPQANAELTPLVVGVQDFKNYPSFSYSYRTQEFKGLTRDILDAFGKAYGYQMVYQAFPIKRLYYELIAQHIDLKVPDNPSWGKPLKRGYNVHYSYPIFRYEDGMMTLPDKRDWMIDDIHSVAYVRGFTPPILTPANIKVIETSQLSDAMSLVISGKVDAVFLNISGAKWLLKHHFHRPDALVLNTNLPHVSAYYYASSVKNPTELQQFNQFLTDNEVLLSQLKQKYEMPLERTQNATENQ